MEKIGILEKIKSNHTNLRTDTMQGAYGNLPEVGETFTILGKGLAFGNRVIQTSPVIEISEIGMNDVRQEYVIFHTENSTYKITHLKNLEDSKKISRRLSNNS